jgi:exonuclease VII small subunit
LVSKVREIKERLEGSSDRIKDSVIELDQIIEDLEKAEITLETAKINLQDLLG